MNIEKELVMTNVYEEVSKKLNELEGQIETYLNKGKGNPFHDKLGRFTTGPRMSGAGSSKSEGGNKKAKIESIEDFEKALKDYTNDKGDFLGTLYDREAWKGFESYAKKKFGEKAFDAFLESEEYRKYIDQLL